MTRLLVGLLALVASTVLVSAGIAVLILILYLVSIPLSLLV